MVCDLGRVAANCVYDHGQSRSRDLGIRGTRQLMQEIVAPNGFRVVIHIG